MTWKEKVKNGYIYKIGTDSYTGQIGALSYGNMLANDGFTDEQIQNSISRSETPSVTTNTKYIKLKDLSE